MRSHWLLLFCLLFAVVPVLAQDPPRALSGSLDENTGQVSLYWGSPVTESDWYEDFEDGLAQNFTYDNAAYWSVSGGTLNGANTPFISGAVWTAASYTGQTWGDGIYEARMTRTAGSESFSQGTFIHGNGPFNNNGTYTGYMFNIAPTAPGYFSIWRIDGAVQTILTGAWLNFPMNIGVGATNTVSIAADGSHYTMYINGAEAFSFDDANYATGQFGVGFADDNLTNIAAALSYEYMAYDNPATLASFNGQTGLPIGIQADDELMSHVPATFHGNQRHAHKVVPNGLLYANGNFQIQETSELDDFLHYNVYRDGSLVGSPAAGHFSQTLPAFGVYNFTVSAVWDEGESVEIGPYQAAYTDLSMYPLNEDFDAGLPETWTVETTIPSGTWILDNGMLPNSHFIFQTPYMMVDSDYCGHPSGGPHLQERLVTPEVDIDGSTTTLFNYDYFLQIYIAEDLFVGWSNNGGATWNNITTYSSNVGPSTASHDLTATLNGESSVWFSWYYDDNFNWGYWAAVDNVSVYAQVPSGPVTLDLIPVVATIPPGGGNVVYNAHILSTVGASMNNLFYRTYVTLPNQQTMGPLMNATWNLTPFMDVTVNNLSQQIPANAPGGDYTFRAIAGVPNNQNLQITDAFPFTKTGPGVDGEFVFDPEQWQSSPFSITGAGAGSVELPTVFAMNAAYPNPFNPTTTVAISLPEASELSVVVFNVMGRQVAELFNGKASAGVHSYAFDGASLASGVYFIQAQVADKLNRIQKVTLMK